MGYRGRVGVDTLPVNGSQVGFQARLEAGYGGGAARQDNVFEEGGPQVHVGRHDAFK